MDFVYVGLGALFFILTWGLLKGCEILGGEKTGEKS